MKKKIVIFIVVGVLVLGLGISLAYFTPIITGSGKEISLVAKELKVIYTDTSTIQPGIIEPSWHTSKTFTVENRSDDVYKYNIVIENLLNTFETEGYLQYRILNTDTGYSCEWKDVPKTTEPTNTVLAYNVEIADGETQSYTIEFRYLETEEDQSEDMGKSFSGNIMIEVGTEESKMKVTLEVINGTVTTNIIEVLKGEDATFVEVRANNGFDIIGATLTCDNEYSTTITEATTTITIPNITTDTTCILKMVVNSLVPNPDPEEPTDPDPKPEEPINPTNTSNPTN